jgi:hypothetical protein
MGYTNFIVQDLLLRYLYSRCQYPFDALHFMTLIHLVTTHGRFGRLPLDPNNLERFARRELKGLAYTRHELDMRWV